MVTTCSPNHVLFDPSDPDFRSDPYPYYEQLRNLSPLYYRKETRDWVVTGYEAVKAIMSMRGRSPSKQVDEMPRWSELKASGCSVHELKNHAYSYYNKYSLHVMQGDEHATHRKLIQTFFSAANLEIWANASRNHAEQLLHAGRKEGCMDLVSGFAKPLALTLIRNILGLPDSHAKKLSRCSNAYHTSKDLPQTPFKKESGMMALLELADLFDACFQGRESIDKEGFLAFLDQHYKSHTMTYENAIGDATMIAIGYRSLQDSLGNAMKNLLLHPDQAELLRQDCNLIDNAINELLRFEPMLQCLYPKGRDTYLGDAYLQKEQTLYLLVAAANRDPAVFTNPNQLDVTIARPQIHLSFGMGPHFCLGAMLARMVMKQALQVWLPHLPSMTLEQNHIYREETYVFRSLRTLPVTFGA